MQLRRYWLGTVGVISALTGARAPGHAATPWLGQWIWHPRGDVKEAVFRKSFDVGRSPTDARIAVTADDRYALYLNGELVCKGDHWQSIEVHEIKRSLRMGRNVIAIRAVNDGGDAGVLVEGSVTYAPTEFTPILSDDTWKVEHQQIAGFADPALDDSTWANAKVLARPPAGPWGELFHPQTLPPLFARIEDLAWVKRPLPGKPMEARFELAPNAPIPGSGPIEFMLRNQWGEAFYRSEHDLPAVWAALREGRRASVTIEADVLPAYLPVGEAVLDIGLAGAIIEKRPKVVVGDPKPAPKVAVMEVRRLFVKYLPGRADVHALITVRSPFSHDEALELQWWRGKELWWTQSVAPAPGTAKWRAGATIRQHWRMPLPRLPKGEYSVRLVAHRSRCLGVVEATVRHRRGAGKPVLRPMGYGTYIDRGGVPHRWHINHAGALIWDGDPYLPVGAMYLSPFLGGQSDHSWQEEINALRTMRDAGVTDLYLNPCTDRRSKPYWVWQRLFDLWDEMGFRYGWQVTESLPPLKGWHARIGDYIVDAPRSSRYQADIESGWFARAAMGNRVMYAVFNKANGDLLAMGEAKTEPLDPAVAADPDKHKGLRASAEVNLPEGVEAQIKFIPEVTFRGDMHDYWTKLTRSFAEQVKHFFARVHPGPGFRCFIDPLDNEQSWRDTDRMVPNPPGFRRQFAAWLEKRYHTIAALNRAWRPIGGHIDSFASAAALVPLGRTPNDPNVAWAADLETRQGALRLDLRHSQYWYDLIESRDHSIRDYNNLVADWLKSVHNVPVVQKLTDTDSTTNDRTHGGFDGLGMEAYGSDGELIRGCGGGVWSRGQQANRTMWTLITETGLASPDHTGYASPLNLARELNAMASIGAKGAFVFVAIPGGGWDMFNLYLDPRQFAWLGAYSDLVKSSADKMSTYEPPVDFSFPGVIAGQLGMQRDPPDFHGTIPPISIQGRGGGWVVPATVMPRTGRLIVNLEHSPATERWGAMVEQALADGREVVVVGIRRNLGALKFDRYYTDEFADGPDGIAAQVLRPAAKSEVLARTADGKPYGLRQGNLTIYALDDWDRCVREMASVAPAIDFIADVQGGHAPDLGPGCQMLTVGKRTYLWAMIKQPVTITLKGGPGVTVAALGEQARPIPRTTGVELPGAAARPVIIEGTDRPVLTGLDEVNLVYAREQWEAALEQAAKAEIEPPPAPTTWRALLAAAIELDRHAREVQATAVVERVERITIDGDLSDWKGIEPLHPASKEEGGKEIPLGDDSGVDFYVGWDEDTLYCAVQTRDEALVNMYRGSQIWNGDALEIFVETRIEKPEDRKDPAYDNDTFQFLFSPTNGDGVPDRAVAGNPRLRPGYRPERCQAATRRTADGWILEVAIPYTELGGYHPRAGETIGFNIFLDDADDRERVRQYLWRGRPDASRNRFSFGRAYLKSPTM